MKESDSTGSNDLIGRFDGTSYKPYDLLSSVKTTFPGDGGIKDAYVVLALTLSVVN